MSDTYYLVAKDQPPREFPEKEEPLLYRRRGGETAETHPQPEKQ